MMYERMVDVPRLVAIFPADGPGHPLLAEITRTLARRYGRSLPSIAAAYYRDGRDSVAMHGDKLGQRVGDSVVALVSLGEPRRFLMKPVAGGSVLTFQLGWGDLLVMGGTCQKTWLHGVPKAARALPRMSVQFREIRF